MKRCCFCSNPEDIVTPKEKRLPSGEETTSSADRSDRSVEGGSGIENGEEKKNKNADETVQKSIDSKKQTKRRQEACMISWVYGFYNAGIGMLRKSASN
ncbi:hypothetical protein T4D_15990 [Trichinella pseudospiralis]|uniref:Uncharacterized protein n=1 Tax=Trichinella pseudospiralis TaxID=6337 RepID=A0A0V1F4X9_TRIPS|nr:hypothetical protein T4D_15990 [Trichinella pseudospiralis]